MKDRVLPRKPAVLSESTQRRLGMYALTATAAGIGLLSAPGAGAEVVYTPAQVKMDKVDGFYPIDFDGDGVVDLGIWLPASCSSNACAFTMIAYPNSGVGDAIQINRHNFTKELHFGAEIGTSGHFLPTDRTMGGWDELKIGSNTWNSGWAGPWANNGAGVKRRYVGLKFMINHETHFGWARINFVVTGKGTFYGLLTGYAYETIPNQALKAGQTKGADEATKTMPSAVIRPTIKPTLGHLAAGALGLSQWRGDAH